MIGDRVWCKECSGFTTVIDESLESAFTGPRIETDFFVRTFTCGHDQSNKTGSRHLSW